MLISIVIPIFNEERTIEQLLTNVLKQPEVHEIIAVDDGSTDGSLSILRKIAAKESRIKCCVLKKNAGKGSAVTEGLKHVTGEIVIMQDADLEYNPQDYPRLIEPFNDPKINVVYGSRLLGKGNNISCLSFAIGGMMLTVITDLLYFAHITDEPTGYKVFRKKILDGVKLESRGFEFCPEVTAKILRQGIKIHEVPISYSPRGIADGKKIRLSDGIIAIWTLLKYRFVK